MISKLIENLLARLFPIKSFGKVDLSHEQMLRRHTAATERFWGGRAPVVIKWSRDPEERIISDNLKRRLDEGKEIPRPIRIIG